MNIRGGLTSVKKNGSPAPADAVLAEYRSNQRRYAVIKVLGQVFVAGALIAGWEALSRWVFDPFWISSPWPVAKLVWEWLITGYVFRHALVTLQEMMYGLVLGSVSGLFVGIMLGTRRRLADILDPYVMLFFAIPKLALTPLMILIFGIGLASKVALVAIIVFFFIFFNTYSGVRDVNEDLINQVRIMGASNARIVQSVLLPAATTWIFTGLRLALRQALAGAVVGEILAANAGLGFLIAFAAGRFQSTGVYAGLVFVTLIAVIMNGIAGSLEARLTRWKGRAPS